MKEQNSYHGVDGRDLLIHGFKAIYLNHAWFTQVLIRVEMHCHKKLVCAESYGNARKSGYELPQLADGFIEW
ncbi:MULTISPECIES: hypothetical protein [Prochlorococcus]|uniref:hypothetical protein n=1 Tax=Prochlorococcus TaxID=1218 RepID=UPI0007B3502C|nr:MULTISPECIES: hypothetical protein [Prochlorococcus]NMO85444.1 hypothetical protein [Prochlorococcus sp. P1344]NMP05447.1 hypothetical protein [Prochlorococcus sp. P1361]NMP13775.1 hypothetical protein [Prochlorococcus sp.P1363]